MPDKIKEIKTIFKSFDLKGSEEELLLSLNQFEQRTLSFTSNISCYIVIMWMKNIFLQKMNHWARSEELLDKALTIASNNSDTFFIKWELKIYLSLGYIHQTQCNYIDADYFLQKALTLAENNDHLSKFLGEICSLLADVNFRLNLYSSAKRYVTQEKNVAFKNYESQKKKRESAIIYGYSLINYCRIKRLIGLVDNTLSPSIEEALSIVTSIDYQKGILRAKLEYAQLQFVMNFTEKALIIIQEIESSLLERRMMKDYFEAGLLAARIHRKMLDYGLSEEKLEILISFAQKNNLDHAQIMSDVYYIMGDIRYETDREEDAFDLFKLSAKIGMVGGVKRNIIRAFNAARLIDKIKAKELLTSDLVYQDTQFVRNRLSKQVSPFIQYKTKAKLFASTLFVDIAGFSSLMKKSDEKMTIKLIDELIDRLCIVIYQNNGYIDKFLGDGFMAIFEHGDNLDPNIALNGIKASVDMNRAIKNKNRRFKEVYGLDTDITFRMGMSTGEIYAIFLGNYIKREFTYLGNAVNLASKLESVASRQGLLLDPDTYALTKNRIIAQKKVLTLPSLGKSTVFHFSRIKRDKE
ncbi:MAG: hypothetical protein GY699_18210 [Desulfobacteraceae bacterium]|nr:hypothetical protein [Desulfobacteraceae bacterium]